ncbi:hypothetical protein [Paenarthrobacter sp. NPDC089316]|uniref:hypothetical protein n=1 Tax=unclassified Paenarthrobacter TaxID=2634190 RepID=UPI00342121EB
MTVHPTHPRTATATDVAHVLPRSINPPGPAQSGTQHLHCGAPMHTGAGRQHMRLAGSNGRPVDADLEAYLNTRVLHCDQCGFQMEIPEQLPGG